MTETDLSDLHDLYQSHAFGKLHWIGRKNHVEIKLINNQTFKNSQNHVQIIAKISDYPDFKYSIEVWKKKSFFKSREQIKLVVAE